ncbi:MAG: histidine kinase [Lachnospiraceae bacterium]|nr:histidine kinase [Lachnospiraceae bacterium]
MKKQGIFSFIRQYRWRSVFFRYLSGFFLIILIIFIPYNLLTYSYMDYVQEKEIASQSTTIALKSREIFDLLTSEFFVDYRFAANNAQIQNFFNQDQPSESTYSTCLNLLYAMSQDSEVIEETFLYDPKANHLLSSLSGVADPSNYSWTLTYSSTKLPFLMFPRKEHSDDFNFIYVCAELSFPGQSYPGVFGAKLNYSEFTDIINRSFEEKPDRIFIVSDIGLILYSDTPELINTLMFEQPDLYTAFNSAKALEGNSIFYDDMVISVAKSSTSNLMLISYNTREHLVKDLSIFSTLLLISAIAILVLSLSLALFISMSHYRSVTAVMNTLDDPEKLSRTSNQMLSEFFYISHTISDISQKNTTISNELDEKIIALKKSQIAALQAQINPHFLFNTLQLINFSILKEMKRDTIAAKLISQLSDLLHYSYDTEHYAISVEQELKYTLKYLDIQKVRYKNRLQVITDIDESCLEFQTLKLILQPLIENSIIHGLKGKPDDWQICLRCRLENGFLVFEISDNGNGIAPENLSKLNTAIRQLRNETSDSIGIINIAQRLKLVFGNQASMQMESVPGRGTTVILKHKASQLS